MQFQSTPETMAQLLFRLMVNWKRCERFFRLYIRFRCLTVVWHSICVRYLQFYASIWNADTALFPFRVQIFSAHTMSQSLDGQMASVLCFSVGLLRELLPSCSSLVHQNFIPRLYSRLSSSHSTSMLSCPTQYQSLSLIQEKKIIQQEKWPSKTFSFHFFLFFSCFRFISEALTMITRLWVLRQVLLGCTHQHRARFGTPEFFGNQFQSIRYHYHMIMWV